LLSHTIHGGLYVLQITWTFTFAPDSLTLNFSYNKTSTEVDMRRYLWNYILT